jgi:hypothetical protein
MKVGIYEKIASTKDCNLRAMLDVFLQENEDIALESDICEISQAQTSANYAPN